MDSMLANYLCSPTARSKTAVPSTYEEGPRDDAPRRSTAPATQEFCLTSTVSPEMAVEEDEAPSPLSKPEMIQFERPAYFESGPKRRYSLNRRHRPPVEVITLDDDDDEIELEDPEEPETCITLTCSPSKQQQQQQKMTPRSSPGRLRSRRPTTPDGKGGGVTVRSRLEETKSSVYIDNVKSPARPSSTLDLFLRVRNLDHHAPALRKFGVRSITDLSYLTKEDFNEIGISEQERPLISIHVVR